jgi:ABC-2 type transport system ATP-binding protein
LGMHSKPVIELDGLVKSFKGHLGIGRKTAVSGLDLNIQPGEIFGLLGPNGAGKTTTIKMIVGLLRPDQGSVRLFGQPPSQVSARARIGFLPENPYFYDYLTAEEFLDFYGRLHGLDRETRRARVAATIEKVGLAGKERLALRKFSKGMVQRLGLAQAILHEPDLVILDEPMSGLDPIGRREVRDLILALRDAGKTVFFSSHILQDAELICDRVGIVVDGKMRHLGSLDEMVHSKPRWFEVSVRGTVPEAWNESVLSSAGGKTLVKLPDVEDLSLFLEKVAAGNAQVVSVWPRRETLEDLFLREVRK